MQTREKADKTFIIPSEEEKGHGQNTISIPCRLFQPVVSEDNIKNWISTATYGMLWPMAKRSGFPKDDAVLKTWQEYQVQILEANN